MKKDNTNQRELLFYIFYKKFKEDKKNSIGNGGAQNLSNFSYTPLFKIMGEWYIEEFKEWEFMSYEVSTTMSKLKRDEPKLFQERQFTLKNGRKALEYRLNPAIQFSDLQTEEIKKFYLKLKK